MDLDNLILVLLRQDRDALGNSLSWKFDDLYIEVEKEYPGEFSREGVMLVLFELRMGKHIQIDMTNGQVKYDWLG